MRLQSECNPGFLWCRNVSLLQVNFPKGNSQQEFSAKICYMVLKNTLCSHWHPRGLKHIWKCGSLYTTYIQFSTKLITEKFNTNRKKSIFFAIFLYEHVFTLHIYIESPYRINTVLTIYLNQFPQLHGWH